MEADIDISRYVNALRRGWKWIALGAIVGILAGLAAAAVRPIEYEASTTIAVDNATPQTAAMLRASAQGGALVRETVRELGLDGPPLSLTTGAFVARHLQIEQVAGTTLFRIKVRLPDAAQAAAASNLLAAKAVESNRRLATTGTKTTSDQLKSQLDASAARLRETEQALLNYQRDAQVEVLKSDTDAMLGERRDLLTQQIELETEKARLAAAQQQIKKETPVLPVPAAMNNGGGSADAEKAFVNPAYETLAKDIARSQTRVAALERTRREKLQVRKLGDALPALNELYARQLALARRQTDYDVAKRVYADLALQYEQSRVAVGSVMQIVDAAVPPTESLPRRRVQSIALGLAAGALLGAALALLLASSRTRTSATV